MGNEEIHPSRTDPVRAQEAYRHTELESEYRHLLKQRAAKFAQEIGSRATPEIIEKTNGSEPTPRDQQEW